MPAMRPAKMPKKSIGRRAVRDKAYLEFIAGLPCIVCLHHGLKQESRTEVCHVGDRGLGQKSSDRDTLPMCGVEHHREGKFSQHHLGRNFWAHWGLDKQFLIDGFNRMYARLHEGF